MEDHLKNKMQSRKLKEQEKIHGQNDHTVNVSCFDLQQVLTTPHSMSSQLYYRRKLATYNLTVFDLARKDGHRYMWYEGVAKRGANNIASCIWKYVTDKTGSGECSELVFLQTTVEAKTRTKHLQQCICML